METFAEHLLRPAVLSFLRCHEIVLMRALGRAWRAAFERGSAHHAASWHGAVSAVLRQYPFLRWAHYRPCDEPALGFDQRRDGPAFEDWQSIFQTRCMVEQEPRAIAPGHPDFDYNGGGMVPFGRNFVQLARQALGSAPIEGRRFKAIPAAEVASRIVAPGEAFATFEELQAVVRSARAVYREDTLRDDGDGQGLLQADGILSDILCNPGNPQRADYRPLSEQVLDVLQCGADPDNRGSIWAQDYFQQWNRGGAPCWQLAIGAGEPELLGWLVGAGADLSLGSCKDEFVAAGAGGQRVAKYGLSGVGVARAIGDASSAKLLLERGCPDHRVCRVCGVRVAEPKRCAKCKVAWYCSRACQASDWPLHKIEHKRVTTGPTHHFFNGHMRYQSH